MKKELFFERFRALHERVKTGALPPAERAEYDTARIELERLLLLAQQISRTGKTLRTALRIAQLVKVEIDLGGPAPERTSTMDLASGGFAALLQSAQPLGAVAMVTLHVPAFSGGRTQAVRCTAKVASSRPQGTLYRVSFTFDDISRSDREALDIAIIDYVLRRFGEPV